MRKTIFRETKGVAIRRIHMIADLLKQSACHMYGISSTILHHHESLLAWSRPLIYNEFPIGISFSSTQRSETSLPNLSSGNTRYYKATAIHTSLSEPAPVKREGSGLGPKAPMEMCRVGEVQNVELTKGGIRFTQRFPRLVVVHEISETCSN